MTWTKFTDAVPTEARSVLVGCRGICEWNNGHWFFELYQSRSYEGGEPYWENSDSDMVADSPETWREHVGEEGLTHWCYVNPPEVSP